MNVSMATVANDLGTTITGIQTAITLYTLVMATMMITGGKIGSNIGRKRAFMIGCVIYGAGSLTTAIAPNLGSCCWVGRCWKGWARRSSCRPSSAWSRPTSPLRAAPGLRSGGCRGRGRRRTGSVDRRRGDDVLLLAPGVRRRGTCRAGHPAVRPPGHRLCDRRAQAADLVGTVLSAVGLGLAVFGVLKSSEWGWVKAKPGATSMLGISLTFWLVVAGLLVMWLFLRWENRRDRPGQEPLLNPKLFANARWSAGS